MGEERGPLGNRFLVTFLGVEISDVEACQAAGQMLRGHCDGASGRHGQNLYWSLGDPKDPKLKATRTSNQEGFNKHLFYGDFFFGGGQTHFNFHNFGLIPGSTGWTAKGMVLFLVSSAQFQTEKMCCSAKRICLTVNTVIAFELFRPPFS